MSYDQTTAIGVQTSSQDIMSTNMADSDGLPDYASIDPNEGEKSVVRTSRPLSFTPLQASNAASGSVGDGMQWPLVNATSIERSDSANSYTSSRAHNLTRAKIQAHYLAGRPATKYSNNGLGYIPDIIPKVPQTACLASGRGRIPMQRTNSMDGFGIFTNHRVFSRKIESKQGSGLLSRMSRISSGWTTMGSSFSSSSAAPGVHELNISGPYELRRFSKFDSGAATSANRLNKVVPVDAAGDNGEPNTESVLMDMRPESRLDNRTSLPVHMPNVISPIGNNFFDDDCGHNTPVRDTVNCFDSPASSPATINQLYTGTPWQSAEIFHNAKVALSKWINGKFRFWFVATLTQVSMLSLVASITVLIVQDAEDEQVRHGSFAWLIASLFWFSISWSALAVLYARHLGSQMARKHRNQQRDEEMFENIGMKTRISNGAFIQNELAHRQALMAADQHSQDQAWNKFVSDPNRLRSYVERLEDELQRMAAARAESNTQKRFSGIFEVVNLQRANPHANMIGIARSDSLLHGRSDSASPGIPPSVTLQTLQAVAPEVVPLSALRGSETGESSKLALGEEKITTTFDVNPTLTTHTHHSAAMANLSSEANFNMSNSTTKSTISSLISSYFSDSDTKSHSSLGRVNEALHSHPIDRLQRPIVTEAGTPNSEKSGDRYLISASGSSNHEIDWTIHDGVACRLATMTPIEERSESASAFGGR